MKRTRKEAILTLTVEMIRSVLIFDTSEHYQHSITEQEFETLNNQYEWTAENNRFERVKICVVQILKTMRKRAEICP
jgi:hypothetical protein